MLLALVVVVLGAYTRLRDAGLGCPDWPGCYGQMSVPSTANQIQKAIQAFPHQPVEAAKAWAEMVHRYVAGSLGVLILGLLGIAFTLRRTHREVLIPAGLAVLMVMVQAMLGMWTVTQLLYPPVVTGHLVTGMALTGLLGWMFFRTTISPREVTAALKKLRVFAIIAIVIVIIQIALGGWTSSNYAGPACPDFPTCHGQWWPTGGFFAGFYIHLPKNVSFLGGLLDSPVKMQIHMLHRAWAVVTLLYVLSFAWYCLRHVKTKTIRHLASVSAALVIIQVTLGIIFVLLKFPLAIAVIHNGVAALLLLSVVALNATLYPVGNHVTKHTKRVTHH